MLNESDPAPSAREFILDLLAVVAQGPVSVATLTEGGEIMGFNPVAIRVAINRLASEGAIESSARGVWRLTLKGPWARESTRWSRVAQLVKPWTGHWLVALADDIDRADRAARRATERALEHRGFRRVRGDVYLRPDNLRLSSAELKQDLMDLGASPQLSLLVARELDFVPSPDWWDVRGHAQKLKAVRLQMERLQATPPRSKKDLCRRFWLLGREAARLANSDPLLPESMVSSRDLQTVVEQLPKFAERGAQEWRDRLGLPTLLALGEAQA